MTGRVGIAINNAAHQQTHAQAMADGLAKHGIKSVMTDNHHVLEEAAFYVAWSVKKKTIMAWSQRTGKPVLIMERGHVQDRMVWTSMGWNGLGNRGTYAKAPDGERWAKHWSHLLKPWKDPTHLPALLLGQCAGDASLYGLNGGFEQWAQEQTDQLNAMKYAVFYRPHPLMVRNGNKFRPKGAFLSEGHTLEHDLSLVDLAVSYNSTAGVEAVLAGVPTVTMDEGAMAYAVTSHSLNEIYKPDRTEWCHQLAWTSFSIEEISSGFAWEAVKDAVALETITH